MLKLIQSIKRKDLQYTLIKLVNVFNNNDEIPIMTEIHAIKPVYNVHLRKPVNVAFMDRWLLYTSSNIMNKEP